MLVDKLVAMGFEEEEAHESIAVRRTGDRWVEIALPKPERKAFVKAVSGYRIETRNLLSPAERERPSRCRA